MTASATPRRLQPAEAVIDLNLGPAGLVPLAASPNIAQTEVSITGNGSGSLSVGLGPRRLTGRMLKQLAELRAARDRMEKLSEMIAEISSTRDLNIALQRTVVAAMRITGARYGAVGVRADDGTLSAVVNLGMPPYAQDRVGQLLMGKGLLGLVMERDDAVRLKDLTQHRAAVGLPEHHPGIRAFLGVPIKIRGVVFGSLCVGDDSPGRAFTESDEIAVKALVAAAAVVIDNLQLLDRFTNAARWLGASRETSAALLDAGPHREVLKLIAGRVQELTDAEDVVVFVPAEPDQPAAHTDTLVVSAAVGAHASEVIGQRVPVDGSIVGEVFRAGTSVLTDSFRYSIAGFTDVQRRPAIVTALRADHRTVLGVIALARNPHQPRFDNSELELMGDFATHTAIALGLATARASE